MAVVSLLRFWGPVLEYSRACGVYRGWLDAIRVSGLAIERWLGASQKGVGCLALKECPASGFQFIHCRLQSPTVHLVLLVLLQHVCPLSRVDGSRHAVREYVADLEWNGVSGVRRG